MHSRTDSAHLFKASTLIASTLLVGCLDEPFEASIGVSFVHNNSETASAELIAAIESQYSEGVSGLILPDSRDFNAIPQDPQNPITHEKVALGELLFHDTAFATKGLSLEEKTWSCASCHHAAAGFKSGIPQGIGEGGLGFGADGSERRMSSSFDPDADDSSLIPKPDIQPLASPTILNSAYQDVMLWNGQFGNSVNGIINAGIDPDILATPDTPKAENLRRLSGLEIQAIAGLDVHRLEMHGSSELQTNHDYIDLFTAAYRGGSDDEQRDAGKAIAAYERTVLANRAPFQLWLRGDESALSSDELRGGALFFGKAGCGDCHRGPALSSEVGATEDEVFMAIGFADFDSDTQPQVHGPIKQADKEGRGGFTTETHDKYQFKIPQLYNLADAPILGHGASFSSVREVLNYKNRAVSQVAHIDAALDQRFTPLGLTRKEIDDLEAFISNALYDPDLMRYQPTAVPSGECIIVDPLTFNTGGLCP